MRSLGPDVRYALRRLRATPMFTGFAIVTLALGIGATTAIYSTIYTVMLRPPDVPNLDRVVEIRHSRFGSGPMMAMSWPDYRDLTEMQTAFDRTAVTLGVFGSVAVPGQARVVLGEAVSGQYFEILGIQPAAGRLLQPADDQASAPPAAVLSDRLWAQLFDRNPQAIGGTVKIDGRAFTIAGVAPATYRGGKINSSLAPTDLWVAFEFWTHLPEFIASVPRDDRNYRRVQVTARLKPGTTIEEAETDVRLVAQRLDEVAPIGQDTPERLRTRRNTSRPWAVVPLRQVGLAEQSVVWGLAVAALVAALLVLLIACTNLANLFLARSAARRHEIAVRLALGASRWRLLRESVVESSLLAMAGGAGGLVLAKGLVVWLSRDLPINARFTLSIAPELDPTVLVLALAATVASLLVFGMAPAWTALREDARRAASGGDGSSSTGRWRGRRWLIAGQVTVSVVLVLLAALSTRQAAVMATEDVGIDLDRLAIVVTRATPQDEPDRVRVQLEEVARQLRQQTGIEAVTVSSGLPLGQTPGARLRLPDQNRAASVALVAATPSLFSALGAPVVRGRAFDDRDTNDGTPVVVLSQALATAVFPEGSGVGRQVELQRNQWVGEPEHPVRTLTVIGIVDDRHGPGQTRETYAAYLPLVQHYESELWLIARATGDPAGLLGRMRTTVTSVAPDRAVATVGTGMQIARPELLFFSVTAGLTALLGTLALVLALAGLFGVLAHLVARRRREIGLRMALGADARQIIRLVLREGMSPVVLGVVTGTAFGIIARMAARPLALRPLPAVDTWALVVVPIPMLIAGLLACYVPARRASKVHPNVALRDL